MKSRSVVGLSVVALFIGSGCGADGPASEDASVQPDAATSDATTQSNGDAGSQGPDIVRPTVEGASPNRGPETGGTRVTIRGTAFLEPVAVYFGNGQASSVTVLDQNSIAATTPSGVAGEVDVRLTTPGGEALLARGFTYHRDLRVLGIEPARIPDEGGVPIVITGRGFDASTIALIGRKPLPGARVVSSERIEGFSPALFPGRPEVHVLTRDAQDYRSDLLVVFSTPKIAAIAPGYGALSGGTRQAIVGTGLGETARVLVGNTPSLGLRHVASDRVEFVAPVLSVEGHYDVSVQSADAEDTLKGAYIAYNESASGAVILGVTPKKVVANSGQSVAIVGRGFVTNATARMGGVNAVVSSKDIPHALVAVVPNGLLGIVNVAVDLGGGQVLTASSALEIVAPLAIDSIVPNEGPATGKTAVTITGSGFHVGMKVRIGDVDLTDVVVVSPTEVTGKTAAGSHGPKDVVVKNDVDEAVLRSGFSFLEPFELVRVDPSEGSIAGNTFVSLLGRGFSAPASVRFGNVEARSLSVENGSVISVRTATASTGRVDVHLASGANNATLLGGFLYYDPRLITGGVWGGPIRGSVNVGVLNSGTGGPMPNMVVQLGYDADLKYAGLTDENGLVTISGPEINGPQTVTVGQNGMQFSTLIEVNAKNLTMLSGMNPRQAPPDQPVQPCPEDSPAPVVGGQVFRFKSSLDPVTRPGWIAVARITYTDADIFSPNPPEPPEQVDYVFADGQTYEIVVMRAGTVALYAVLGEFNRDTQEFIPKKLGIVRNVPASPGQTISGINIPLDIDLTREIDVRLAGVPTQIPGPSISVAQPFLNLGSDGVIPFGSIMDPGSATVHVEGLPDLPGANFFFLAGSFTGRSDGSVGAPYSLTFGQSEDDEADGIDLGPFVNMPEDVTPKLGEVARGGRFSWTQPGLVPDLVQLYALDVVGLSSCCCLDGNRNGTCETNEPQQCGGMPIQFVRWNVFGPGGLMSYAMPKVPSGINAFEPPRLYTWVIREALAPRFDYREWMVNQYSPYFWRSWNVWYSQFLAREETD